MLLRAAVGMLALAEAPLLASSDVVDGAETHAAETSGGGADGGHASSGADGNGGSFTLKAILHCDADELVQRVCALRAVRFGRARPPGGVKASSSTTSSPSPPLRRGSGLKPLTVD